MRIIIAAILAILISVSVSTASTVVYVPGHKPVICFGCHFENGYSIGGDELDDCGGCHTYRAYDSKTNNYSIDIPLMEQNHNPQTCPRCHKISDTSSYHATHAAVNCQTCHANGMRPPNVSSVTDCKACHSMVIHELHKDKLQSICVTCHRSSVPGSASSSQTSQGMNLSTPGSAPFQLPDDIQRFTIYEFLRMVYSLIF